MLLPLSAFVAGRLSTVRSVSAAISLGVISSVGGPPAVPATDWA
jgi:hypothetical protein